MTRAQAPKPYVERPLTLLMRLGFLLASLTIASICIASPPVTIQQPSTANTWVLASCAWMLFLLLNALFIAWTLY